MDEAGAYYKFKKQIFLFVLFALLCRLYVYFSYIKKKWQKPVRRSQLREDEAIRERRLKQKKTLKNKLSEKAKNREEAKRVVSWELREASAMLLSA